MSADQTMIDYLNKNYDHFAAQARAIWENPEIGLQEKFASKLIAEELEKNGFEIEWSVGQMETAFIAS
jgi:aminobenzoyl-glutamate utilization protein B